MEQTDQNDPGRGRVDRAILLLKAGARESASAPASSTPVGPPPTTTKVSHASRFAGSPSLSACSNASSIRLRIVVASSMLLRSGRVGRPFVSPERAVPSAGSEDEVVERNALLGQDDLARGPVHADHLTQTNGDIALVPQDASNGQRDIGRRQGRGRHLV